MIYTCLVQQNYTFSANLQNKCPATRLRIHQIVHILNDLCGECRSVLPVNVRFDVSISASVSVFPSFSSTRYPCSTAYRRTSSPLGEIFSLTRNAVTRSRSNSGRPFPFYPSGQVQEKFSAPAVPLAAFYCAGWGKWVYLFTGQSLREHGKDLCCKQLEEPALPRSGQQAQGSRARGL